MRIGFGIDDPLVGFDGWQRWRVERPENSVWKRQPFRCLGRVAALVLRILFGIDGFLAVFGGWEHAFGLLICLLAIAVLVAIMFKSHLAPSFRLSYSSDGFGLTLFWGCPSPGRV